MVSAAYNHRTEKLLWLKEVGMKDIALVGGKNASLGEMIQNLASKGIKIPNGFVVTTNAYLHYLRSAGLYDNVMNIASSIDHSSINDLKEKAEKIRWMITNAQMPKDLEEEIYKYYKELGDGKETDVAVRSSATAEDLSDASFAGQQETFLNVKGKKHLIGSVKNCFASLFTERAISYRHSRKIDDVAISITVQKMVRSEHACSGVMFSIDTESGFKDVVLINSTYGLGEALVKGIVNPDEFIVFKPTLKKGYKSIISKKVGSKSVKIIYSSKGTEQIDVPAHDRNKFSLTDDEIIQLANYACIIEDYYKKPMDIEWAKDSLTDELLILQARPETIHSIDSKSYIEEYELKEKSNILVKGLSVGSKIGVGKVNVVLNRNQMADFKEGEILVTDITDPDWEPIMKKSSAIVTNKGGRTCHAAIVSRELGIPCIVGTEKATGILKDGQDVTVSCAGGEIGEVYDGKLKYEIRKTDTKHLPETKTKIMMNIGIPDSVFSYAKIPCDGVGLAREEFIISSYIGIHPLALVGFDKLTEDYHKDIVKSINEKTGGYEDKRQFFIDNLAQGVARIASAFYPKDVIVRLSDFKTNEYSNLIGGELYEPVESNPMIGWRGASRYYDNRFIDAFKLECIALKKARDELGLTNIKIMVPFCRTPEEGKKVIKIMEECGLKQGDGLQIYVMCEIPSNVILAEEFAEIFDGFSIGSNDLTQLILGLDRDSELVSHIYDERNEAVKKMIRNVIKTVKSKGKKIGICGQAPSDFPDFAEFLVECEIDSISLNPDTIIKTKMLIAEKEKILGR
ncbi:MAG: phosphoenolpyruvate synthase [Candidatus Aenigmarchaeota archaeon]|nr:phosphoenolpyruvate synthase [Candidatus Aenigmarchaeota archaeon]